MAQEAANFPDFNFKSWARNVLLALPLLSFGVANAQVFGSGCSLVEEEDIDENSIQMCALPEVGDIMVPRDTNVAYLATGSIAVRTSRVEQGARIYIKQTAGNGPTLNQWALPNPFQETALTLPVSQGNYFASSVIRIVGNFFVHKWFSFGIGQENGTVEDSYSGTVSYIKLDYPDGFSNNFEETCSIAQNRNALFFCTTDETKLPGSGRMFVIANMAVSTYGIHEQGIKIIAERSDGYQKTLANYVSAGEAKIGYYGNSGFLSGKGGERWRFHIGFRKGVLLKRAVGKIVAVEAQSSFPNGHFGSLSANCTIPAGSDSNDVCLSELSVCRSDLAGWEPFYLHGNLSLATRREALQGVKIGLWENGEFIPLSANNSAIQATDGHYQAAAYWRHEGPTCQTVAMEFGGGILAEDAVGRISAVYLGGGGLF